MRVSFKNLPINSTLPITFKIEIHMRQEEWYKEWERPQGSPSWTTAPHVAPTTLSIPYVGASGRSGYLCFSNLFCTKEIG
jgi:hypothetical protein